MRIAITVLLLAVSLAAPATGRAQQVRSFAELPLRINRDDRVRVVDRSGARIIGRAVSFGRDGLAVSTDGGERRFTNETVRGVDVSGPAKKRGTLIGAGVFAVLGTVACSRNRTSGCESWPVLDALLFGAPLGLLVGSWTHVMHPVYRTPANGAAAPARVSSGASASLLDDLGMRVNLGDRLSVERASGGAATGTLTNIRGDTLMISDEGESGTASFTRATMRRVSVVRGHTRLGTLLGFVVGAGGGASSYCFGSDASECPDAIIMLGGLGAGVGALGGALFRTSAVVYPAIEARVSFAPAITRGGVGLRATLRF